MKILHTADWHIGSFNGPEKEGVNLRSEDTLRMKKNLRRVAEKYKKYEVSFDYCKQVAASYAGMLEHVDGNRFKDKLWEDFVLTHNMEE